MAKSGLDPDEVIVAVWWIPLILAATIGAAITYWPITIPVVVIGIVGRRWLVLRARAKREAKVAELADMRKRVSDRVDAMPRHDDFVRDYCAMAEPAQISGIPA